VVQGLRRQLGRPCPRLRVSQESSGIARDMSGMNGRARANHDAACPGQKPGVARQCPVLKTIGALPRPGPVGGGSQMSLRIGRDKSKCDDANPPCRICTWQCRGRRWAWSTCQPILRDRPGKDRRGRSETAVRRVRAEWQTGSTRFTCRTCGPGPGTRSRVTWRSDYTWGQSRSCMAGDRTNHVQTFCLRY
jgi:hypothetical protein